MRSGRPTLGCLVVLACLFPLEGQTAEGFIAPGEERFKINLGGVLYRSDTRVRIDGTLVGTEFGLEDRLGLARERSAAYAEITWRFAARHRLGLRAFQLTREAQRTIDTELRIEDRVLPINTRLRAESRTQFFIADYRYSFVKNPRLELAGVLGVFGGRYRFRFEATSPLISIDERATAPIPVVGASLDWFVTRRWTMSGFVRAMRFDLDELDARVHNVGLSTDYMLTRHFGLGVAYNVDSLRVGLDRGSFHGRVGLSGGSLIGYLQARF